MVGYGEGGLIALYAAAADPRIDAAWVGGYFGPREAVWREPIYRNVWGLLEEFGDAEIAGLIAPRALLVEACRGPEVAGPAAPRDGRAGAAPGRLTTPDSRASRPSSTGHGHPRPLAGSRADAPDRRRGRPAAVNVQDAGRKRLPRRRSASTAVDLPAPAARLTDARPHFDPRDRAAPAGRAARRRTPSRLIRDLGAAPVCLLVEGRHARPPERWAETIEPYRQAFDEELIGRFPTATGPLNPHDRAALRRAEVDRLRRAARRLTRTCSPTASCSCRRTSSPASGGRSSSASTAWKAGPRTSSIPRIKTVYNAFAAQLADRGYIVYAPQNPYIGKRPFRTLQRKANPLEAVALLGHRPPARADARLARRRCPSSTRTGSPSTACPTAARPPCASRPC